MHMVITLLQEQKAVYDTIAIRNIFGRVIFKKIIIVMRFHIQVILKNIISITVMMFYLHTAVGFVSPYAMGRERQAIYAAHAIRRSLIRSMVLFRFTRAVGSTITPTDFSSPGET